MLDSNKKEFNVLLGYPLCFTESPRLHNMIYERLGLRALFLPAPMIDLKWFINKIKQFPIGLAAVTMPYKKEILKYVDIQSPEVKELKAANTIIKRNNLLFGYNTDLSGIEYALRNAEIKNKNVLIVGSGGAAQSAAYYFKKMDCKLFWINRTYQRAQNLINIFGGRITDASQAQSMSIDVIVNTTPLGMFPNMEDSPLPGFNFKANQIVFDMVYNPIKTRLLKDAEGQGAKIISGLDMFIWQGLKQIEIWLEREDICDTYADQVRNLWVKGNSEGL